MPPHCRDPLPRGRTAAPWACLRAIQECRESDHQTMGLSRDSAVAMAGWNAAAIGLIVRSTEPLIELAHEHPIGVPVPGGSAVRPGGERTRPRARLRELRVPVLPVLLRA